MEISAIMAQEAVHGLERVLFIASTLGGVLVLVRRAPKLARGISLARRIGRALRAYVTWRALPILGLPAAAPVAVAFGPPASFTGLDQVSSGRSIEPPWAGVSGFSPPRLLARSHGSATSNDAQPTPMHAEKVDPVHPAIHRTHHGIGGYTPAADSPRRSVRIASPLFPRAGATSRDLAPRREVRPPVEKRRAMQVHPAGSALPAADISLRGAQRARRYVVRSGDTLWGIAKEVLQTSDARRIARYWPRIHRANRDVVGRDPNLIYPGQVLHLPPEK